MMLYSYQCPGDSDGVMFMWHLAVDGESPAHCVSMNPLERHQDCIREIHYSPVLGKMSRFVSCSFDDNVHLYHGSNCELIHKIGAIKPFCLRFSQNGETFVVGGSDGRSNIYDGFTGDHLVALKSHSEEVSCIAFTTMNSEQYLVTGSYDGSLRVWNPETGECVTIMPLKNYAMFVEFCQNDALVIGTYDGHVYVISLLVY